VNLTPNAVHALDRLGTGEPCALRGPPHPPDQPDLGHRRGNLPPADERRGRERYGAPQLTIHRADLLAALEEQPAEGTIRFGARVAGIEPQDGQGARAFA
jgi:salicylate hydroxylase